MPELPEVEVVRRGLAPYATGWVVESVSVFDRRALSRHRGSVEDFQTSLQGRTLRGAIRRGKFLWLGLSDRPGRGPEALVCHLGMSGQVLLGDHVDDFGPLLRVALELHNPQGQRIVWGFVDQRLFGSLAIDAMVETNPGTPAGLGSEDSFIPSQVAHIARDPLDPALNEAHLVAQIRRRTSGIKRVLLNQNVVSGIGNIYADEALWATQLHYDYPANRLSRSRVVDLLGAVRDVFGRALSEGGTSFDWQYVNVNGQSGYFSQSLNAYGQDGRPCGRCGRMIVREPWMNRSSFRCTRCQPRPRKPVG